MPVADRRVEGEAGEAVSILQGVGGKVLACGTHLHATQAHHANAMLCPVHEHGLVWPDLETGSLVQAVLFSLDRAMMDAEIHTMCMLQPSHVLPAV